MTTTPREFVTTPARDVKKRLLTACRGDRAAARRIWESAWADDEGPTEDIPQFTID